MHVQLKYVYGQSGINNNKQRGTHGLTQLGEINSNSLQTTQAIPHAKEKKINKVHPSFHTKHTDNQDTNWVRDPLEGIFRLSGLLWLVRALEAWVFL